MEREQLLARIALPRRRARPQRGIRPLPPECTTDGQRRAVLKVMHGLFSFSYLIFLTLSHVSVVLPISLVIHQPSALERAVAFNNHFSFVRRCRVIERRLGWRASCVPYGLLTIGPTVLQYNRTTQISLLERRMHPYRPPGRNTSLLSLISRTCPRRYIGAMRVLPPPQQSAPRTACPAPPSEI